MLKVLRKRICLHSFQLEMVIKNRAMIIDRFATTANHLNDVKKLFSCSSMFSFLLRFVCIDFHSLDIDFREKWATPGQKKCYV